MLHKNVSRLFSTGYSHRPLAAYKFMRSLSETALLYKPARIRQLSRQQSFSDRVVQAFFDTNKVPISVYESEDRLSDITQFATPSHSYYEICLPFQQNPILQKKMAQFANKYLRAGRLLELMDYMAANVAYRYCTPESDKNLDLNAIPFMNVTAAIDSIEFYYPISVEINCNLSGYVTFVGKSSIEVHIDVLQNIDGVQRLACSAKFVMVSRNKLTRKANEVPKLNFQSQKQHFRIIHELGFQRQQVRKRQGKQSIDVSPPTYEESVLIHKLITQLKTSKDRCVSISSTILTNTQIMHVQDKNLSGKIFGGMILRIGYELGWLCAYKFLKNKAPVINQIDDVQFLAPVEIGSYIQVQAKICYISETFIHVVITCHNYQINGQSVLTNILRATFQHNTPYDQICKVYPQSLDESYAYIESKRRIQKLLQIR